MEVSPGLSVLAVDDGPTGARTFATKGLCLVPHPKDPGVGANRFEIVAASRGEDLTRYVATAAFILAKALQAPLEGRVVSNIASRAGMDDLAGSFPHGLFLLPDPWDELVQPLRLPAFTLVPMFLMPLAEPEHRFLKARGMDAFLELLRRSKVDAFDLHRDPMVVDRVDAH
ncbi:MAG: suppressor of fused domain protein [Kofleriaceae bacterium]|nr:suppressor of fused domain protein [Kofleriaceae bacterium]